MRKKWCIFILWPHHHPFKDKATLLSTPPLGGGSLSSPRSKDRELKWWATAYLSKDGSRSFELPWCLTPNPPCSVWIHMLQRGSSHPQNLNPDRKNILLQKQNKKAIRKTKQKNLEIWYTFSASKQNRLPKSVATIVLNVTRENLHRLLSSGAPSWEGRPNKGLIPSLLWESFLEIINEVRLWDLIKSSNTVILQIMTEAFFKAPLQHFKFIQSRNCFKRTVLDSLSCSQQMQPRTGRRYIFFYLLWGYSSSLIRLLINYVLHGICQKHV